MESTAIRYDFSFPPKTTSGNNGGYQPQTSTTNNNRHNSNYQHFNMSKSVSSSLLSCATTNNYQQHSVASNGGRYRVNNNSSGCYGCSSSSSTAGGGYKGGQYHHHGGGRHHQYRGQHQYNQQQQQQQMSQSSSQSSIQTVTSSGSLNGSSHHQSAPNSSIIVAPGTPKDGNCSFTFDELKNTLSFMDDSPLVNTSSSNTAAPAPNNVNNSAQMSTMLMVNPSQTGSGESMSLHSGGSSSSGMSSGSYVSSSSNTGSGGLLPKSISASSLSAVSTSPVSMNSSTNGGGEKRPLTGQNHHHHHHHQSHTSRHSVGSRSECGCNHHHNQNNQSPPGCSTLPTSSSSNSGGRHTVGNSEVYMRRSSYNETAISPYDQQQQQQSAYHTSLIQPVSVVTAASSSGQQQQQQQQQQSGPSSSTNSSIETAAKKYRFAAQNSEATCHWSGKLPPKQYKPPLVYSTKVFVGGLPWDICESDLVKEFGVFGPCRIEFTNKERYNMQQSQQQSDSNGYFNGDSQQGFRHNRSMMNLKQAANIMSSSSSQSLPASNQSSGDQSSNNGNSNGNKQRTSPGFAYVIYENECSVRALVGNCIEDYQNGRDRVEYYYKISTRRVRNKEVQIIPWILADNNFATCTPKDLDPKKTVFVGNLHGTMTARDLAHIMNELFGSVVYAGIDIDKLKYPIGSGRVTFAHQQNFMRAVRAAFVDINSFKFSKRIQIDPYLEDVQCCSCMNDKGIYFCRDFQCFNYYCGGCWEKQHSFNQLGNHKPLMRKREEK